jgi:amidase
VTRPNPNPRAIEVNGKQRPYFNPIPSACLATSAALPAAVAPAMLGADGLPRGVQSVAGDFEVRTAIACAAMLETRGGGFHTPPMASP